VRIVYLIGGLAGVIYGVGGALFKERMPPLGFSTLLIFKKSGGIPWWLGAPFYIIFGMFCLYLAFAK